MYKYMNFQRVIVYNKGYKIKRMQMKKYVEGHDLSLL